MEIITTIAIGAAKFIGFSVIILPIAVQMVTGPTNPKTKIGKFYWEIWPMIILCGIGLAAIVMAFYVLGKG